MALNILIYRHPTSVQTLHFHLLRSRGWVPVVALPRKMLIVLIVLTVLTVMDDCADYVDWAGFC